MEPPRSIVEEETVRRQVSEYEEEDDGDRVCTYINHNTQHNNNCMGNIQTWI